LSDNENATNSDCQLHVRLKLKLRLSRRNKEIGKVPVDFPRHLTAGDKRQMKQTLKSHSKQKGKKYHTPSRKKLCTANIYHTFSFFLSLQGVSECFLGKKAKVCDMCKLLAVFPRCKLYWFSPRKVTKEFSKHKLLNLTLLHARSSQLSVINIPSTIFLASYRRHTHSLIIIRNQSKDITMPR